MSSAKRIAFVAACVLAVCWGQVGAAQAPEGGQERLLRDLADIDPAEHIQRLSAIQSRFTGYAGCQQAEQYVLDRYDALGLANISREPFQIIVPVDAGASLTVGDRQITVHCVRPYYVRTPTAKEGGLAGHLVWGGDGYVEDFDGADVEGSIVLMEFNTATRWLTAANLGARAIVFLEPLHSFRADAEQKYSAVPVPVPRYYLERKNLPALAAAVTGRQADQFDESAALEVLRGLGRGGETAGTIVDAGASLTVGERRLSVHCVRPNYVRTPTTREAGLAGHLVWAGDGYVEDFDGTDVDGSIVLMEFNTATRWLTAANLGARAIVFLEPLHAFRADAEQKYSAVPVPVPRYYLERKNLPALAAAVTGRRADQLDESAALEVLRGLGRGGETTGTIRAKMVWEEKTVYVVSGQVPGTDPSLGEQTVVCQAFYDSSSVVPALAPGAESACGIAAQFEIAELLLKHPPRRTVKFLATPGHFQALAGVRHYAFKTIFPRREEITGDDEEARAGEPFFFIGLDLSSRHNAMAGFYKGNFYDQFAGDAEMMLQRIFSDYSRQLQDWAEEISGPAGMVQDLEFQSGIVPRHGRDWRSLLPDLAAFDAEVIGMSGRPAITLATTGDPRNTVNTPLDTYESMEPYLGNVRAQAIMSAYVVKRTADMPVILADRESLEAGQMGTVFGRAIEQHLSDYVPSVNVPDAVVGVMLTKTKSMMGVKGRAFARTDVQGLFEVFGLKTGAQCVVDGFVVSPASGAVEAVAPQGLVAASNRQRNEWDLRETDLRLNLFDCVGTTVFELLNPLYFAPMVDAQVLGGESNSAVEYLASFSGEPIGGTSYDEPVAVFYTQQDRHLKIVMGEGMGLLLNVPVELSEKEKAFDEPKAEERFQGEGFLVDKSENFIYHASLQMARDMHLLDYYRLRSLKKTFILKRNVWDLHQQAHNQLVLAYQRLQEGDYSGYQRAVRTAQALENLVYPDARGTVYDVLRGVIFYFALLLPFVIFAERLLVNYADIRKKLAAIAVLFVISYGVLMLVHPAFRLSKAPIIILDGFFMLVFSLWTVWYLMMKFQAVMDQIKRHIQTIHRADVARASAAMAAFILGISNMRKRKVRTLLTALTLILLTFTILSFTSFETAPAGLLEHPSSRKAPYEGVVVQSLDWQPLTEFMGYDVLNYIRTDGLTGAPRAWFVSRDTTQELKLEISRVAFDGGQSSRPGQPQGGRPAPARGRSSMPSAAASALLGLSPEENQLSGIGSEPYLLHGAWFDRAMQDWPFVCILPSGMMDSLRLEAQDVGKAYVSTLGRRLRVVGVMESRQLRSYSDLDGESLTPVDFVEQQAKEGKKAGEETGPAFTATGGTTAADYIKRSRAGEEQGLYIHMHPERVLIIPDELCLKLGGTLRSIAASPVAREGEMLRRSFMNWLREFAKRASIVLFAGADGVVHRLARRPDLSMAGAQGLIVPILIAALIVFNTMLGAVYERVTEIKVYASVGLAPIHIGALFFAESCVFAVVGAMMGYLLGQTVSFGLIKMPWLLEGISLNYSSISAVWSALLVMVVVLASTAYPARMAGKLSVPDETRKMVIPKPTGDVWELRFPFTVSSKEALGVMSYLHQYFASNDEDSVGAFTADNVELLRAKDAGESAPAAAATEGAAQSGFCIRADVWVAPLDMGISQHVRIQSVPDDEEPDITYLFFTITRSSGEFATWHRMNMGFLKDLRKQLLIWRLVTVEEKQRLSREGQALLDGAPLAGTADQPQ